MPSGLTPQHHARLVAAGADPDVLASLDLRLHADSSLGGAWTAGRNALYVDAEAEPPRQELVARLAAEEPADALVVIGSQTRHLVTLQVRGEAATVFIGPECEFTAGEIYCGGTSSVIVNGHLTATWKAVVDARNGGSIVAAPDQLWATNVYIATDDMHRLEDLETGARLNPFGAHIKLGHHVWLGRDAVVTGHADIGDGAAVGMRSLVRGQKVPPHTTVAGVPARIVRDGTTWTIEDLP